MRTALRSNEAAQGIFRLIAAFGAAGYDAAVLLVKYEFDITKAALHMGLSSGCADCASGRRRDVRRGCETCVASLRQRIHRVQDRAYAMLGDAMPTTRHVRTRVQYGADRGVVHGHTTIYQHAAAPEIEVDEFDGAEGG